MYSLLCSVLRENLVYLSHQNVFCLLNVCVCWMCIVYVCPRFLWCVGFHLCSLVCNKDGWVSSFGMLYYNIHWFCKLVIFAIPASNRWTIDQLPTTIQVDKMKLTNKRPMGHIAHLMKQFKSINTYDYIITLIKRRKNHQ